MNAFLFIPMLAAAWACGFALALFAAHYFLTVLESTAAGSDKIVWPEEPLVDWFWKAFYLAYLGGVWITPLIVAGRLLTPDPLRRVAFIAAGFWLFFPIGMISSQSAPSRWVPFYPGVVARLGQRKAAVFGFYLVSVPSAVGLVGSIHLIFRAEISFVLAALLAPVGAAAFLIYARCLGRLGLVLSFTKGATNEPLKSRPRKKKEASRIGEHTEQPINKQPSELPPVETPYEGAITGYNVVFDDRPPPEPPDPPPRPRKLDDSDEATPLQMAPAEADSDWQSDRPKLPPLSEPSPADLAMADGPKRVQEPNQPYDATLLTFLFESRSASAWFVLSIGLALLGGMIGALRELKPA